MSATLERAAPARAEAAALSTRTILRFYVPLALSWLLMGLEGPVCLAAIERMAKPEVGAAAFSVVFAIAMWIESPIIDLLATATTLVDSRAGYAVLRRFAWALMGWVMFAHAMVACTPLYWTITEHVAGYPKAVVEAVRPGLIIMVPWSAIIGWRRSLQGILIRAGRTRAVGIGTILRGVTMASIVTAFFFYPLGLTSVQIGTLAITIAVAVEAVFVQIAVLDPLRRLPAESPTGVPLTRRRLWAFHFPLTATTMVNLLMGPLVTAGLAHTPHPIKGLAAYQVAVSIVFLFRMCAFCLPEVVITLGKSPEAIAALRRFSLQLGVVCSVSMLAMAFLGADRALFRYVLHAPDDVVAIAHWIFLGCTLLPVLDTAQSFVRGLLTAQHRTTSRLVAVGAAVSALGIVLLLGVTAGWPAPPVAAGSVTAALCCELGALVWALRRPTLQAR